MMDPYQHMLTKKQNVLYLMIVNMPSDEELADAMAEIERQREGGFKLPGFLARF